METKDKKKRRGVGQTMDDGSFIFTPYNESGKKKVTTVSENDNATLKETDKHLVLTVKFPKDSSPAERYEILCRCFSLVL